MKQLTGIVINTKSQKTAVVEIVRRWTHPLYKKTITKRKKYLVHNLLPVVAGDRVIIEEFKPVSKRKHWQLVKKI